MFSPQHLVALRSSTRKGGGQKRRPPSTARENQRAPQDPPIFIVILLSGRVFSEPPLRKHCFFHLDVPAILPGIPNCESGRTLLHEHVVGDMVLLIANEWGGGGLYMKACPFFLCCPAQPPQRSQTVSSPPVQPHVIVHRILLSNAPHVRWCFFLARAEVGGRNVSNL